MSENVNYCLKFVYKFISKHSQVYRQLPWSTMEKFFLTDKKPHH